MEAKQLKTVEDLNACPDEQVELIDGEIVRRPMARFEHGLAQSALSEEVRLLRRRSGPGGWWIVTEVSVLYSEHQCPTHDLAAWRKEHIAGRPSGVMTIRPDWVCEILSPGHEKKDLFHHFMLLQRAEVPWYWVLSPEDNTLIAYGLDEGSYRVIKSFECYEADHCSKVRIPPFEELEIDLAYIFGDEPHATGA
jgi:Uma2 family endonuclease